MGTCIAASDTVDEGNFTHQPQKVFNFKNWVTDVAVSPDKSILAIGWGKENIQTVKADGWTNEQTFQGCCYARTQAAQIKMAFQPESQILTYRWNDKVRFRTVDGAMDKELKNDSKWVTSQFSPGGVYIAVGDTWDKIRYFNMTVDPASALIGVVKGRTLHQWAKGVNMPIQPKWCPDISNGCFNVARYNKTALVYKVSDDGATLDCELEHDADVNDFIFCNDGKILLIGMNNGNYRVWDFATRQKIKDIKGISFSSKMCTNFQGSFAPDNHAVAVMGEGKRVYVYKTADLMTPDEAQPLVLEADTQSCAIEWSPDSQKLAIGAWYETIVMAVEEKFKIAKVQISAWDQISSFVVNPKWIDNDTIVGKWDKSVKVIKLK